MLITDKFGRPVPPLFPASSEDPSKQNLLNRDYLLEKIVLGSRVIIVEGISGSGKDTLQKHLKSILRDRDIHDYSEGEVLQSWNQLQIKGIGRLQIKFMKLFLAYIKGILDRDEQSVFLLNRFHLSAYVLAVFKEPKLKSEYDEIVKFLRKLPVHVFILHLDANEIEKRSLHPERSGAWQKFQEAIVKKEGFRGRLERYMWQQRLMAEAAETHQLPYSVIKLPAIPGGGLTWVRTPSAESPVWHRGSIDSAEIKRTGRKSGVTPAL